MLFGSIEEPAFNEYPYPNKDDVDRIVMLPVEGFIFPKRMVEESITNGFTLLK
jgi:hypothetical protein